MSARWRAVALGAALVGACVAGYLTWVHYADIEPVCVGGGAGCERVQASDQSELAGIPVALLGLFNYALIAVALLTRTALGQTAATAMALTDGAFSLYLTYVGFWVIEAICQWCVANAVIATLLAGCLAGPFLKTEP